jgi:hypothetical protein
VYDANITYDVRFFDSLNRIVQAEPWPERDKAMIDQLKSIGIAKGIKAVEPNPGRWGSRVPRGRDREAHIAP